MQEWFSSEEGQFIMYKFLPNNAGAVPINYPQHICQSPFRNGDDGRPRACKGCYAAHPLGRNVEAILAIVGYCYKSMNKLTGMSYTETLEWILRPLKARQQTA